MTSNTAQRAFEQLLSAVQLPHVQRRLMQLAVIVLALISAILLARWVWLIATPATPLPPTVVNSAPARTSSDVQTVNVGSLMRLQLFGENVSGESGMAARNAPKTQLNVRLVGVSASSIPERSAAIIEQGNQQLTYIVGDELQNSRVKVAEIYADRVILDNNGRLETLELEGIGELSEGLSLTLANSTPRAQAGNRDDQRETATEVVELNDEQAEELNALRENPGNFLDYVQVAPVQQDGELQGYRLSPGSNPDLFRATGLQPGDLAISINGYELSDMQQAMTAMEELQNGSDATITVLRDDQYVDVVFELPRQ